MSSFLLLLTIFFYGAAALAVCGIFFFLYLYATRKSRRQAGRAQLRNSQQDFTHMVILFQTMRDVLEKQKGLARQFNESLDKKIALVRRLMANALKELEKLRETQRQLAQSLDQTKADVAGIQREAAFLRDAPNVARREPPPSPVHTAQTPAFANEPTGPEPLQAVAGPDEDSNDLDLIDNWVGLDLGGAEPESDPFPVPQVTPDSPEDRCAAREAFRALLDLEPGVGAHAPAPANPPPEPARNGNGHTRITPIQARVYEYADAGMSVHQIAHELGVGKGEVRLMLGLRKDREH